VQRTLWTVTYGKGRIVQTPMGHDVFAMRFIGFISTMERSVEWAATGKVTSPIPQSFPGPTKASQLEVK
jgi:type 1 glutamine amidotransferase